MRLWNTEEGDRAPVKGRLIHCHNGRPHWVLATKRAFHFDGQTWHEDSSSCQLYDEPVYAGKPGFSAMYCDQDMVVAKRATDVYLYGKARTPARSPQKQMLCRLFIHGHIEKAINVIGERTWVKQAGSVTVSHPVEFTERVTDYSLAMGGRDERNRVGCGVAESLSKLTDQPVPSVFSLDQDWQLNAGKVDVCGFGAVPPFFMQRAKLAGTFDKDWIENRKPLFPADFDLSFYQSAPADQQCNGFMTGGERLVAAGFHPDFSFNFLIPDDRATGFVKFRDGSEQERPMELHTLFIDTDVQTIWLTYSCAFDSLGLEEQIETGGVRWG